MYVGFLYAAVMRCNQIKSNHSVVFGARNLYKKEKRVQETATEWQTCKFLMCMSTCSGFLYKFLNSISPA